MKTTVRMIENRIATATKAWEGVCPQEPLSGLTLDQFRDATKPSLDARMHLAAIEVQWQKAIEVREAADEATLTHLRRLVNAVKAHPKYGENSALYASMGYVKASQRSTGLTRKREKEAATAADEAS